ncbi:hypothetical protein JTE90_005429 [Oedothorax gibbosus]|uniref:Uncharacterized protein n=1 Tax=Oedothorax gibbosus TaxID=931172 RepID=A0AAV6TF09_9ARAC|nr:hypothetical protein JTE90_005429 [Oedothorax gibbosus]
MKPILMVGNNFRLDEVWVHVGSRLQEIYEEEFACFQKMQFRVKNMESAVENLSRALQVKSNKVKANYSPAKELSEKSWRDSPK